MNLPFPSSSSGRESSGPGLIIAQYFFLIVGLLTLGYCAYTVTQAHLYQAYESWRLDQMRQNRPASVGRFVEDECASLWSRVTGHAKPASHAHGTGGGRLRTAPSEGSLLGRIAVPRIGLSSVVLEGDDTNVLKLAVGHIPGTALPGEQGNIAIAGHRDTFFRGLRDVRKNDEIALTTPAATYRYRVESTEVVEPDDTAVLKPSVTPSLTLVTCYPFNYVGSAPERFIVRAQQVAPVATGEGESNVVTFSTLAASRLPPALPGEFTESKMTRPRHRQLHRRHAARSKSAVRETASESDGELTEDSSLGLTREQRTRGLASRLRSQWSRLFAHLKANTDEEQ
jgi:sortase A